MSTVNIRRDVKDAYYRYKMPKIIAKIEGKGNGIKTVVPNMSEVAKALNRPPSFPTKYFGCELGAQVKCEAKNDRYIINGAHDNKKLQALLDGFITKFVLCASCKNPETDLIITKDEMIIRDCKACGERSDVDMRHKLASYILKNPPENCKKSGKKSKKNKASASGNGSSAEEKDKRHHSSTETPIPTPPDSASLNSEPVTDAEDGDDELTRTIAAEVAAIPQANDDDDDDWCVDTSPEAVAARMKASLSGAVAKLAAVDLNDNGSMDDDAEEDPLDVFAKYVEEEEHSNKEIIAKAKSLGIRDDKACAVLAQVLFDEDVVEEIPTEAPLLLNLCKNEKCQKAILGGIERLVVINYPSLMKKIPFILKALYDADIVDEEVLLAWGEKASKRYVEKSKSKEVRKAAAPFLNWLREAEEESDEEDEEDDE